MNWKKCLLAICLLTAAVATADEQRTNRVIENPVQDGNLVLRINDGGVKTDAFLITGSTGSVTIGPASGAANHIFQSGANTAVYIDSSNSSADLAFRRSGTSVGSASLTSSSGVISLYTGGASTANPFLTRTISITASGALTLGSTAGNSWTTYLGIVSSGTTTCTSRCLSEANPAHNLDVDSGQCLLAWRSDTGAGITCSDATSVGKKCMCAGVF